MIINILYASGVLFYSKSVDNTIYFLLGKDIDSKWSDFGGGCELSDKGDTEITATREAWEETLGAVYDYDVLRQVIKSSNIISSRTPSGKPYYMYLVNIPFMQTYREKFICNKKFLSRINVEKKFLEINDIKWVSLNTIENSLENKRPIIKLRNIFEKSLKQDLVSIVKLINNSN